MSQQNTHTFLQKKNESRFSIATVIFTFILNILFVKSHVPLIKFFMLYIPSFFILISFYFMIKHGLHKQEVSHDSNSYTYIEDTNIPKSDRLIIFLSLTVCVWMVITTGTFLKLFMR